MDIFQNLNDEGITVVMVTHEPDIARHAKRIVTIRDGRIVDDEPVSDRIYAREALAAMVAEREREQKRRLEVQMQQV